MNHRLVEAVVDGVVPALRDYIEQRLATMLDERLAGLKPEKGEKGDPGEPGAPGRDGVDGKDGANGKDGVGGPPGPPGADGAHGKDGRDGVDGKDGANGLNGADGAEGTSGRDGLPGVPGRNGEDGKDGLDGLGFDDLTAELDKDGRTVILRFVRGERTKEFRLKFQTVVHRGVWEQGRAYDIGDAVTWGGQWTVAVSPTTERPGTSNDWNLAVRKGRDGKDAVVKAAPPAEPIKLK